MITFFNHKHVLHQGRQEMFRGQMVPCFELAARADQVLSELTGRKLGPVQAPPAFDDAVLERVHTPEYLSFLRHAWADWVALDPANVDRDALPSVWPNHGLRRDRVPDNFAARMGLYAFDTGSPLTSGTWEAAREGAGCALAGLRDGGERERGCCQHHRRGRQREGVEPKWVGRTSHFYEHRRRRES